MQDISGPGTEAMADPEAVGTEAKDEKGSESSVSGCLVGVLALCSCFLSQVGRFGSKTKRNISAT